MPERATDNCSDPHLLRSNIPEYSFVGFAGATSSANTVALTILPAIEQVPHQHRIVLGHHGYDDGWVF